MTTSNSGTGRGAGIPGGSFVLREYAFLADGHRGALIDPRGRIEWMCVPSWDSDAVFAGLLGGRGGFAVTPTDARMVWGGYYDEGTLIWNSRWVTSAGEIECREALAFPGDAHRAVLLRQIRAVDGDADVEVSVDVRGGFGRDDLQGLSVDDGTWTGRCGGLRMRFTPDADFRPDAAGVLRARLVVPAGQVHDLMLEIGDRPFEGRRADVEHAWQTTEQAWDAAKPKLVRSIARRDAIQAHAVLRGMTNPDGGMVAAATMSLPERAEAGRNYDYRYVWIRDQCFAGLAAAAADSDDLLDSAVTFVSGRLLADGPNLAPAYTVGGDSVPSEQELRFLPGYPGGSVKSGNWVRGQMQLDAFGESLLLLAAAAGRDRLDDDGIAAIGVAVGAIARRWLEPDAGIWELTAQQWTHSKLTCVAGLRAATAVMPPGVQRRDGERLADMILTHTNATSLHPSGRWQRTPEDQRVDAALLLPAVRGGLPADDPRTIATRRAVTEDLEQDGYVYRFQPDERPLGEAEGAFLLCGLLAAWSEHQAGNTVTAGRWFERNRAACGSPGLYSEEYDIRQRQLRGNLPQAFVHALLLECAVMMAD